MGSKKRWVLLVVLIFVLMTGCNGSDDDDDSDSTPDPDDDDDDTVPNDDDDDTIPDDDDDDDDDDDIIPTLGKATVTPSQAPADSKQTYTVQYTAGSIIQPGGGIKIYFGAEVVTKTFFPCIMTTNERKDCGYTTVETDNPDVTVELTVTSMDPHPGVRLWAAIIDVTKGTLQYGDRVTLNYGVNDGQAATQQIAQDVEITVLVRQQEDDEYVEIEDSPVLTVTPLEPAKLVTAVDQDNGVLKLAIVDEFANHVTDFDGQAEITLIDEAETETYLGTATIEDGMGTFDLPTLSNGYYLFFSVINNPYLESRAPYINKTQTVFFGDPHFHTKFSDSYISYDPAESYEYGVNVALLDFVSVADHAECVVFNDMFSQFLTRKDIGDSWEDIKRINKQYNQNGTATINGYEVTFVNANTDEARYGHINAYFRGEEGNLYTFTDQDDRAEGVYNPDELWAKFDRDQAEVLTIPHHTLMAGYMGSDFAYYNPKYMRLVEIYSHHGCSESKDAPFSVYYPQNDPDGLGEVRRAIGPLQYRLGFTGGSDNHFGHPAGTGVKDPFTMGLIGGLTGVVTNELTRDSLWTSMYNRATYATTGERIYLEFSINGQQMGQELYDQTAVSIQARAIGVRMVYQVEIFKYDDTEGWRLFYDTMPIKFFWNDCIVDPDFSEDSIYYMRVTQIDGHLAWSSPIWVNQSSEGDKVDLPVSPPPEAKKAGKAEQSKESLDQFWRQLGYM